MWVFELTEDEVSFLFMPETEAVHENHEEEGEMCRAMPDTASAIEVAAHIRKFITSDGIYAMSQRS
jgi:hypothetical protein